MLASVMKFNNFMIYVGDEVVAKVVIAGKETN